MRLIDADKIDFSKAFGGQSEFAKDLIAAVQELIDMQPTAFDKEKVIEELKSWEKASYNTGIARAYSGLDRKASECYQESRAYHRAVEIIEKGGIE